MYAGNNDLAKGLFLSLGSGSNASDQRKASMKQEFTVAAAWTAASSWLEQIAAALVFVVIARLIGVEDFGIAAMAFAFLFLGEVLVRDTITEAIIERHTIEEGRLEATFFALLSFSVLIVLGLLLTAPLIAHFYGEPSVAALLMVASPTIFFVGLGGVSTALLRRRMEYKTLAIRTIVGVLAGGVVGIFMAFQGYGAWSLVGQRLTEIGFTTVLAILGAKWRPARLPSWQEISMVRGLGVDVLKLRFWTLVLTQTPTVMLGIFSDARAAGLFAFAARLIEMVLKLSVSNVQGVAQSAIAALRRKAGGTDRFYLDITELSAFAGFLSFAGLAMIAGPLTRVLLGEEWDDASRIVPFLCIAGAALAIISIQESYLLATDGLSQYLTAVRLETIVGLVLIGLASRFGEVAVGAAIVARALALLPLRTAIVLRPEGIGVGQFLQTLIGPLIVAALMCIALFLWYGIGYGSVDEAVYVVLAIIIGSLVAGAVIVVFMPATYTRLKSFVFT